MRDPSPYAGTTKRLRADAVELGGLDVAVVDWYENTGALVKWRDAVGTDPRAEGYYMRRGRGDRPLPEDDDVLFGRVDGMGALVHLTEIEGATGSTPNPYGPKPVDDRAAGLPCSACHVLLVAGDTVAALPLGPGSDPAARALARTGQPYEAVIVEIHWACHTGDESYSTPTEA